jgi:hypothetical protein
VGGDGEFDGVSSVPSGSGSVKTEPGRAGKEEVASDLVSAFDH